MGKYARSAGAVCEIKVRGYGTLNSRLSWSPKFNVCFPNLMLLVYSSSPFSVRSLSLCFCSMFPCPDVRLNVYAVPCCISSPLWCPWTFHGQLMVLGLITLPWWPWLVWQFKEGCISLSGFSHSVFPRLSLAYDFLCPTTSNFISF